MRALLSLIALTLSLTGCSTFPQNVTWEMKKENTELNNMLLQQITFLDTGKAKTFIKIVRNGQVTKKETFETDYECNGNILKVFDPKSRKWRENTWEIQNDKLTLISKYKISPSVFTLITKPAPSSRSATEVNINETVKRDGITYVKNSNTPYTGTVIKKNPAGELLCEYSYKDGKIHGERKEWHKNGKLKSIKNFKYGVFHGLRKEWYKNGQLCGIGYHTEGKKSGVWKSWTPAGELEEEVAFLDDKRHGQSVKWYNNNQKKFEMNYKHGKPHGSCRSWYNNGQLRVESHFQNGSEHGQCKKWDKTGKLLHE